MAKVEAGYIIKTPVVETDARGALGLLRRLSYDEIIQKKDIKKYLRQSLNEAKKEVQASAKSALPNDPRRSYLGVKVGIYKKTLGGNISLYNQRSTGKRSSYELIRGGASGILRNRKRSKRTNDINAYYGRDRAFILRMHNQGTTQRIAFTRTRSKNGKTANRGSLRTLNFFASADGAIKKAAESFSQKLERAIVEAGYGV